MNCGRGACRMTGTCQSMSRMYATMPQTTSVTAASAKPSQNMALQSVSYGFEPAVSALLWTCRRTVRDEERLHPARTISWHQQIVACHSVHRLEDF